MANYITELKVSLNPAEEVQFKEEGFTKIDVNMSKGTGGNRIFLWYKKQSGEKAITKVQFTFNDDMATGLNKAGYTKIRKDLSAGARSDHIFLWYSQGQSGEYQTPIADITVTADANNVASKFVDGWERVSCDLNREIKDVNWIHIWLQRENPTYICDVTATDSYDSDSNNFTAGYTRVDENVNRGAGGDPVFIWYLQTTDPNKAFNDLQVSTNDQEYQQYHQQHYTLVDVNLNEGTVGNKVYMWYKKGSINPIKDVALILNTRLVQQYKAAGVTVIPKNLNNGNGGWVEHLCYYNK